MSTHIQMTIQTTETTASVPSIHPALEPDAHVAPQVDLRLPAPRRSTAILVLCALWAAVFFASLFAPPLLDDADSTHSNAARHILATGDWVTLYANGIRYLEKAPLPYWLVASSFRIFGFNTFAAHLPQAIAVLLLALLGYYWAAKAFSERTGLYTGVAVLTSAGVFLFTRIFIPEVWLSLFLATALYCLLQSLEGNAVILSAAKDPDDAHSLKPLKPVNHRVPAVSASADVKENVISTEAQRSGETPAFALRPNPNLYPYLMWTALALAVLTKGLVAPVFIFGTAILYLALTGEHRRWRALKPFTGILLFLAIAAPWHILAGLRNTDGALNGHPHGFFWFYFVNEHFLRFLGKRYPVDYNKLPGYLFWSLHLVWLFPWALFAPLGIAALWRRDREIRKSLPVLDPNRHRILGHPSLNHLLSVMMATIAGVFAYYHMTGYFPALLVADLTIPVLLWRRAAGLAASPFHDLDSRGRTTLLLSLFSVLVLLFFSLSTNQEYYTFPAYLPLLMLLMASLTRAESTYATEKSSRRWITFAHAALTVVGAAVAIALFLGLWSSRHLPFVPDIGELLAHRGVGDYTLSMSHLFDLTGPSFAALRLPAILAAAAFAFGPAIAWFLRTQGRHLAATSAIALTSATFLIAAHIALVRFGPMLSSQNLAAKITDLRNSNAIAPDTQIMLYGDQSYGSSIPFYLGQPALLVEGRSSSMIFGSSFPDAPHLFLTNANLIAGWGTGTRKLIFVPLEKRDDLDRILPTTRQLVLAETSGKALITDRPLDIK